MGRKVIDLTGQRFGRLVVFEYLGREHHSSKWSCICDCGTWVTALAATLKSGTTKSCGCYRRERMEWLKRKHGERGGKKRQTGSPEYKAWDSLRQRCMNPNDASYEWYGAKGVRVCERWNDFANFLADMGRKPSSKHSIDREDSNGNYEPNNCRWATGIEQARNRSNNRNVLAYRTLKEAAEAVGISYVTVKSRLGYGWSIDDALNRPVNAARSERANRATIKARARE